jgi:hypothetical protein
MTEEQTAALDCWAIVEMFGHQRVAGRVKTENFGAACLLRIDVPEVEKQTSGAYDYDTGKYAPGQRVRVAAFTKYLGLGAIYALNPVTEELARAAAADIGVEPVRAFGLESVQRLAKALPQGDGDPGEDDDDEEDGDVEEELTAQEAEAEKG